jgi:hypothetical protein
MSFYVVQEVGGSREGKGVHSQDIDGLFAGVMGAVPAAPRASP